MKRRTLAAGLAALPLAALPLPAPAQPAGTIRLVVPFPPGGASDVIGRVLAEQMRDRLGQPVVVDNRAGASGNIGADIVAKARPEVVEENRGRLAAFQHDAARIEAAIARIAS